MKQVLFLLFTLFFSATIYSQSDIKSAKKSMNHEDFISFLKKEIEKNEVKLTNLEDLFLAYYYLGKDFLVHENNPVEAKKVFDKGYALALSHNNTLGLIRFKRAYGDYYEYQNNLKKSIEEYLVAISYAEKGDYTYQRSLVYSEIARPYYLLENYDAAIEYLLSASKITDDKFSQASLLNNIGIIYKNKNDWNNALKYYFQSLKLTNSVNDTVGSIQTLDNIGSIFVNKKQYDSAFHYYNMALKINPDNPNSTLLSNVSQLMLTSGYGEADKEIEILNDIYKTNLAKNNLTGNLHILETLYKYYESSKNYSKAYEYLAEYLKTYKSVIDVAKVTEAQKMKEEYDAEKRLEEIKLLKEKNYFETLSNKQNKILIIILLSLLIAIVCIGLLWLRNNITKQNEQKILLEQQLLRSQMNPHFIFNSISNIQSFILEEDNNRAIEYLGKFSKLTRQTLENSQEQYISLEDELLALKNYIDLQKIRFTVPFQYHINIEEKIEEEDIFIPPMLIQPIIENALIHGIKPLKKKQGKITLKLYLNKSYLRCEVTDNGVGRKNAKSNNKKSMSTNITKKRLIILSDESKQKPTFEVIDLENDNHEALGTQVILDIPIKK